MRHNKVIIVHNTKCFFEKKKYLGKCVTIKCVLYVQSYLPYFTLQIRLFRWDIPSIKISHNHVRLVFSLINEVSQALNIAIVDKDSHQIK